MLNVGDVAACVMRHNAVCPPLAVTTNCRVKASIPPLAVVAIVIENTISCIAPGSPDITAPLFVESEWAEYDDGSAIIKSPTPSENVSLELLVLPSIVILPPAWGAAFAASIITYSDIPFWVNAEMTSCTLAALKVIFPYLGSLPL